MNALQPMKVDERSEAIRYAAHMWAYNVLVFALLIDISCRSMLFHETSWDLFALIGASGFISLAYAARHKGLRKVVVWRLVIILTFAALFAAVLSALLAMGAM